MNQLSSDGAAYMQGLEAICANRDAAPAADDQRHRIYKLAALAAALLVLMTAV